MTACFRRGGAGRLRRQSASPSIAGIVLHCREPPLGAMNGLSHCKKRWGDTSPQAAFDQSQSIRSSFFSRSFPWLIPSDRAAPSYQLLDLSLAIRPAVFFFLVAGILSLEPDALLASFLDNCCPP
jgi:hypothetical protein